MRKYIFVFENDELDMQESFHCKAESVFNAMRIFTTYRLDNAIKVLDGSLTFFELPL
jgi:hypothetical protein